MLLVVMTVELLRRVWHEWRFFLTPVGLFSILSLQLNVFSFVLFGLTISHTITLYSMLGLSATGILFIQIKQLSTLLYFPQNPATKRPHPAALCIGHFIKHYTITMGHVFVMNQTYGKSLFTYMACHWPISMIILVFAYLGKLHQTLFLIAILTQMLSCFYGNHFLAAFYSRNLHQPARRLMSLNVRTKLKSIRNRLKLSLYSMMLHTTNPYGIAYGNAFGLITFRAFFKVGRLLLIFPSLEPLLFRYRCYMLNSF